MWTSAARAEYGAFHRTYPSSTSDEEWALIAPTSLPRKPTAAAG